MSEKKNVNTKNALLSCSRWLRTRHKQRLCMPPRRSTRRSAAAAAAEEAAPPPADALHAAPPPPPPAPPPAVAADEDVVEAAAEPAPIAPPSPSSSSSSDFDDVDVDAAIADALAALEAALEANPADYDASLAYIATLRGAGMGARLADARAAAAAAFPLPEPVWLEWIQDATAAGAPVDELIALHEAAVADYVSVPLWASYLATLRAADPEVSAFTPAGVARFRTVADRALTAAGLHVSGGASLWSAAREFEVAAMATGVGDAATRARRLWHGQLATPLAGNAGVLDAARAWEAEQGGGGDLPPHVVAAAEKAATAAAARGAYESAISPSSSLPDADRLAAHLIYIKLEEGTKDPARIALAYERAVAAFPATGWLWLRAGRAVERAAPSTPAAAAALYRRATRNCPWVGAIWARALRAEERCAGEGGPLGAKFEELSRAADAAPLTSPDDILDVGLARIDALRRRADWPRVRQAWEGVAATLKARCPACVDANGALASYRARCELEAGGGDAPSRALAAWTEAASTPAAGHADFWIARGTWAADWVSVEAARSAFSSAVGRRLAGRGAAAVAAAWLRVEREHGSAADHLAACLRAEPVLEAAATAAAAAADSAATATAVPPRKRARGDAPTAHLPGPPPQHQHADATGDARLPRADDGEHRTAFVRGVPPSASDADIVALFTTGSAPPPTVRRPRGPDGTPRGFAYVEFESPAALTAALALDGAPLGQCHVSVAVSNPPAPRAPGGEVRGGGGDRFGGGRGGGDRGRGRGGGGGRRRGRGGRGDAGRGERPHGVLDVGGGGGGGAPSAAPAAPKSNADFRAMLLGKK